MAERGLALVASCLVHIGLVAATFALAPAISTRPLPAVLEAHLVVEEPITPPRLIEAPLPKPVPRPVVARPRPQPAPPPPAAAPVNVESTPPPVVDKQPEAATSEPPPPSPSVVASGPATPAAPTPPAAIGSPGEGAPSARTSSPRLPDIAAASAPPSSALASRGDDLTHIAVPRGGYQVRPSYPAAARRSGAQGTTLLRVFVDAAGRVADVLVHQSAGHQDLDQAAADAVRRWRFEPARRGAEPVAMWVLLPVEFRLR